MKEIDYETVKGDRYRRETGIDELKIMHSVNQ